jgi:dTDP-4-dehydrorhamnose 3,5-epimerase
MPVELQRTPIHGVWELLSKPFSDQRGSFLNGFRRQDSGFAQTWQDRAIDQVNISHNATPGCVRGLHLQTEPHREAKLVRCLRGRVWDVAVDLRPESTSFGQWHAVELSAERCNALLVPEGCAHGFQVLEAGSELLYLHSGGWTPEAESGVRFNDPDLAIPWPLPVTAVSERDQNLPLLQSFS